MTKPSWRSLQGGYAYGNRRTVPYEFLKRRTPGISTRGYNASQYSRFTTSSTWTGIRFWKKTTNESTSEDPSRKLAIKKEGIYRVFKAHGQTITIDVLKLHNTVSVDRVALAPETQQMLETTTQARSPTKIDDQLSVHDKKKLGENTYYAK